MVEYPDIDLENLLMDRKKGEVLKLVEILVTRRGRYRPITYLFQWYCHRVKELGEKRTKFNESLDFVLNNYSYDEISY